ncbi:MAG: hypothetical protein ABIB97_04910 [Patescibacteria group bacterium]
MLISKGEQMTRTADSMVWVVLDHLMSDYSRARQIVETVGHLPVVAGFVIHVNTYYAYTLPVLRKPLAGELMVAIRELGKLVWIDDRPHLQSNTRDFMTWVGRVAENDYVAALAVSGEMHPTCLEWATGQFQGGDQECILVVDTGVPGLFDDDLFSVSKTTGYSWKEPGSRALHYALKAKWAGVTKLFCSGQDLIGLSEMTALAGCQKIVPVQPGWRYADLTGLVTPAFALSLGADQLMIDIDPYTNPLIAIEEVTAEIEHSLSMRTRLEPALVA